MRLLERSIRGFAWNHVARVLEYGLTYLLSIILARSFEPAEYGTYVTMMSIASATMIIGGLGLDETLNKFGAQISSLGAEGKLRFLIRHLLGWRFGALVLIAFIMYLFRFGIAELFQDDQVPLYILVLTLYVVSQSLINYVTNIHTSLLQTQYVLAVITGSKIANILLASFLLSLGYGLKELFSLFAVTTAVSLVAYGFTVRSLVTGPSEPIPLEPVRRFGLAMWGNALLALMLGRHAVILITGTVLGMGELSAYLEMAFSLTLWIEYIFSIGFIGVILTVFSELAARSPEKLGEARKNVIRYYQMFILPVSVFCLFYTEEIITLVFTERYLPAAPLFRLYLGFNLVSIAIVGGGVSMTALLAQGHERIVLIIRSVASIANVAGVAYVASHSGGTGIVTLTGLCVLVKFAVEFLVASRFIGFRYDFTFLLKVSISVIVAVVLVNFIGSDWHVLACASVYVAVVIAGFFCLRLFFGLSKDLSSQLGISKLLQSVAKFSE